MSKIKEEKKELENTWTNWLIQYKKVHWIIKIISIIMVVVGIVLLPVMFVYHLIKGIGVVIIRKIKKLFRKNG